MVFTFTNDNPIKLLQNMDYRTTYSFQVCHFETKDDAECSKKGIFLDTSHIFSLFEQLSCSLILQRKHKLGMLISLRDKKMSRVYSQASPFAGSSFSCFFVRLFQAFICDLTYELNGAYTEAWKLFKIFT